MHWLMCILAVKGFLDELRMLVVLQRKYMNQLVCVTLNVYIRLLSESVHIYIICILLYFFFFCLFNNCDSLQIAILPYIFCNPPNITLIMPFKLNSCSKSFSNVTIDHGSQFQPPRVLQRRLGLLWFHCGIDLSGTRLTLTTTLVAREDQKHLKALKWHLCILPRSDISLQTAIKEESKIV